MQAALFSRSRLGVQYFNQVNHNPDQINPNPNQVVLRDDDHGGLRRLLPGELTLTL